MTNTPLAMPDDTMTRTEMYLPEEVRKAAKQIGDGTMAEGVRRAVRREIKRQQSTQDQSN